MTMAAASYPHSYNSDRIETAHHIIMTAENEREQLLVLEEGDPGPKNPQSTPTDYVLQNKCEDTTSIFSNCRKLAQEMKDHAAQTLGHLHHQAHQITQTHNIAHQIDYDLTLGEKLLGSLGSVFSSWRPRKARPIRGPANFLDNSIPSRGNEQGQMLLNSPCTKVNRQMNSPSGAKTIMNTFQMEKNKQDECLSEVSVLLDQLKDMAIGMGHEIARQNKALEDVSGDISELGCRIKGANAQSRRLLGK